ncbi:Aste57867_17418 [Aphanomyces stellatus]|uniref:Aste57867_17418 protein n=1 Tax=Aphanomyces stellatus TaxID=120398 RepID=A0A485LBB4_9STRA|nr:hypothetical protein As57867_017358 [Aphanomyces stellatus]VFT94174.1 Aste57867_17418 [Aphanomyces stellatus]
MSMSTGHGAGSIVEWRDSDDKLVQAYLVYPDGHVGRIMTGVVIVPDCAGFSTAYVRTFADKLSEQGYKVIVPELPTTGATNDEWTNSGMFRKWRDAAVALEPETLDRVERCRDLLKQTYEVQRVGILGLGYGAEVALRAAPSFDCVAVLSPTALPPSAASSTPTLVVTGDRNEFIDSSHVKAFLDASHEATSSAFPAVRVRVVPGQRHGFALSRIADEDAATLAIADILDWFITHLHRFRVAACTSDGDPWWPQGKNGPFYNAGLGLWQQQRAEWIKPVLPRPPKRPPVPSETIFEGLSSMKRTFELPQPMALADIVELYVDIWDINL